jgi:hypothetical protein
VGEYAEARIEFAGSGTSIDNWPAWWVTGPNWPAAGENDIAEGLGTLTVNYHSPSGAHNMGTVPGVWSGGFHTYGIYRGSNYCDIFWDGKLVDSYSTDDNGAPQTLEFTMGAANNIVVGDQGAMKIDYVRAWSGGLIQAQAARKADADRHRRAVKAAHRRADARAARKLSLSGPAA